MKKLRINKNKLRKLEPTKNVFLSLASSIIYQQISTSAGNAIYKKFLKLFKGKPSAEKLLKLSTQRIRNAGISPQKLSYLIDLAKKFSSNSSKLSKVNLKKMKNEEVKQLLLEVKGIGPWTVDMFLIFALNRPDILPIGDLGIRKGFKKVFNLKSLPTEKTMHRLAQPYTGTRTYLSLHLWKSLE